MSGILQFLFLAIVTAQGFCHSGRIILAGITIDS